MDGVEYHYTYTIVGQNSERLRPIRQGGGLNEVKSSQVKSSQYHSITVITTITLRSFDVDSLIMAIITISAALP